MSKLKTNFWSALVLCFYLVWENQPWWPAQKPARSPAGPPQHRWWCCTVVQDEGPPGSQSFQSLGGSAQCCCPPQRECTQLCNLQAQACSRIQTEAKNKKTWRVNFKVFCLPVIGACGLVQLTLIEASPTSSTAGRVGVSGAGGAPFREQKNGFRSSKFPLIWI